MWEQGYPGRMVGYTSCLAAGIAKQLMLAPEAPDIRKGIRTGLSALRCLHREGYGQRGAAAAEVNLEFPAGAVVDALASDDSPYQETAVRCARGPGTGPSRETGTRALSKRRRARVGAARAGAGARRSAAGTVRRPADVGPAGD